MAWDGSTVASGLMAEFVGEALVGRSNRDAFLGYLEEASQPNSIDHTAHSGNGVNLMAVGDVIFLDHDHLEDRKALFTRQTLDEVIDWIKNLEARGFPTTDPGNSKYEFEYISEGPAAESEFRLRTGFRGSTAWA